MKTIEILRFIPRSTDTPKEYVLRVDEEDNRQTLYINEEEVDFFSTEGCCGNYVIKRKVLDTITYPDTKVHDLLFCLLKDRTVERQLGALSEMNDEYKMFVGNIMNEIKNS